MLYIGILLGVGFLLLVYGVFKPFREGMRESSISQEEETFEEFLDTVEDIEEIWK